MSFDARIQRLWYGPAWRSAPLWPLEAVFRMLVALRSAAYKAGLARSVHVGVPVVVVGNLTVGGTGKTPLAAWLGQQIGLRGHRVGVVLRGYGGSHSGPPRIVRASDDPSVTGDEAILHARRGSHVVVIGADRVAAARLAREQGAELILADDGLQHRRLARDVEIAVVDGERGLGNGRMLPAGPLREPVSRLESVQAVVCTDRGRGVNADIRARRPLQLNAKFQLADAVNLATSERKPLAAFVGQPGLHAVAGIGHPDGFFRALRSSGLEFVAHALPDHTRLVEDALPFPMDADVLMTEKDAVKCRGFGRKNWWWVELDVGFDRADAATLLAMVLERTGLAGAGVRLG